MNSLKINAKAACKKQGFISTHLASIQFFLDQSDLPFMLLTVWTETTITIVSDHTGDETYPVVPLKQFKERDLKHNYYLTNAKTTIIYLFYLFVIIS